MATTQLSASPSASASASFSLYAPIATYVCASSSARSVSTPRLPVSRSVTIGTPFVSGSPLFPVICRSSGLRKSASRATSVTIRCEQSANEGNSLDVWLGRLAMVGFAVAISVEIATGKGLLENFGLTSPLPTVALAITALVGVLTSVFIFQSASKN